MYRRKKMSLTKEWLEAPKVVEFLESLGEVSDNQRKLLTPVIINSNNIDAIRRSFLELYRKTGKAFSPLSFRYSFAIDVKGGKNVTIVPFYYLEKDVEMMLSKYKIVTHLGAIKPMGTDWEQAVYAKLKYFHVPCEEAVSKLITTKVDGKYAGWEFKEIFKDSEVL